MKSFRFVPFLSVLVGLASCTGKPVQPPPNSPAPLESTATPTLAALLPTATLEAATESSEGLEKAGLCGGVADNGVADDGWRVYCNSELGYSFHYPADATLEFNPDRPADGVSVIGPESNGERWPWIEIRHPQGQAEYSPPADVDLQQWLADHYLVGAPQLADVQIAGARAVHLRFDRSPHSYAFDRYYFARAGQLYMVLIAHTGDREEWDLYNHFLESFSFDIDL